MADYILVVELDIPNELEDDFNRAYDEEHVPNLLNVSGVHGCEEHVPNLLNVSGVHGCDRYKVETSTNDNIARYAAVYHIDSPDIPDSAEWREWADKEGEWVSKIRPNYSNRTRTIYKKIN